MTLVQAAILPAPASRECRIAPSRAGWSISRFRVDAMASKLIENMGSFDAFEALVGSPRANDDGRAVTEAREAICAILLT